MQAFCINRACIKVCGTPSLDEVSIKISIALSIFAGSGLKGKRVTNSLISCIDIKSRTKLSVSPLPTSKKCVFGCVLCMLRAIFKKISSLLTSLKSPMLPTQTALLGIPSSSRTLFLSYLLGSKILASMPVGMLLILLGKMPLKSMKFCLICSPVVMIKSALLFTKFSG